MPRPPVTDEIGIALGQFFYGGAGPSHTKLRDAFVSTGYGADDPYSPQTQTPNKEARVRTVVGAACRRPDRARERVDAVLMRLRVHGCFDSGRDEYSGETIKTAQSAFRRAGWALASEGVLEQAGSIDLTTGGRAALDEQLHRLQQATEDPGQLLGTAKDLLEAVSKFVLEDLGHEPPKNASFDHLWYLARERLGVLPEQVDADIAGGNNIKAILQSSWKIAEQVNKLRGLQGAGHGRTLPTGVSTELAFLVVREACSVAEYALTRLERQQGQRYR